jgi:MFS family permease
MEKQPDRLALTIFAHAILRIASSASGVLIGIYLANLSGHGLPIDAGMLGVLGAVSFAAELIASIPFGIVSDAISPRWLMVSGALIPDLLHRDTTVGHKDGSGASLSGNLRQDYSRSFRVMALERRRLIWCNSQVEDR